MKKICVLVKDDKYAETVAKTILNAGGEVSSLAGCDAIYTDVPPFCELAKACGIKTFDCLEQLLNWIKHE